jgi:hypothetical protein
MQLRHISPRSSDWVDAMDEGGRGWEKLAPEERSKLRLAEYSATWAGHEQETEAAVDTGAGMESAQDDYGWGEPSASR